MKVIIPHSGAVKGTGDILSCLAEPSGLLLLTELTGLLVPTGLSVLDSVLRKQQEL